MLAFIVQVSVAFSSATAAPVDGNFERVDCMRARAAVAGPLINGIRLAKVDSAASISDIPEVVAAMFDLNERLNQRPTRRDREIFSDCVNSGVLEDVRRELANVTPEERAHLRLYVEKLRREGAFETKSLAAKRARRKTLRHDAVEFGSTMLMLPAMVLGLAAMGMDVDSAGAAGTAAATWVGALWLGAASALGAGANDWRAVIHRDVIGFAARSCGGILSGASHFEMPLPLAPPALAITPR